jgi:DNA-directed RNA polymerase subunit K/omega
MSEENLSEPLVSDVELDGSDADEGVEVEERDEEAGEEEQEAEPEDDEEAEPEDEEPVAEYSKDIIIVKEKLTSQILTKFEITELVSIRAAQIERKNDCMVDISGLTDPILMARRELMMRMSPLLLRRYLGDRTVTVDGKKILQSYYEVWNPNTMIFAVEFNV